jgi:hypothetical protein
MLELGDGGIGVHYTVLSTFAYYLEISIIKSLEKKSYKGWPKHADSRTRLYQPD